MRSILVSLAMFAGGFLLGALAMDLQQPPSRREVLEKTSAAIIAEVPGVHAEITREDPLGEILYVSMTKSSPQDEYLPVARVEIGYEGQILASIWSAEAGFYEHHLGKPMTQEELVEAVRQSAAERS